MRIMRIIRSMRFMNTMAMAAVAVAAALASMPAAQAYYDDYLPAPMQRRIQPYAQRTIATEIPNDNWSKEIRPGVTARTAEGYLTISGKDAAGKDWSIREDLAEFLGGSLYAADLDRNGREDIVMRLATGACGLPWSVVFVYLFDRDDIPHKQEAVSRFDCDEKGLSDLIEDPDGQGAILLIQDLAQATVDGKDHSYWRFSALRPRNMELVETDKLFGVKLPSFVLFTNKPNHKISKNAGLIEKKYREQEYREQEKSHDSSD